ncbi:hypothetical protein EDD18DRAFT_1356457 [Armillaria luteobubalina]|uniref:Uncharacterized protein n=1 Tax=Armillaria luteobubalina TaxID=153913 RepID=A0AA39Q1J5_9AGAR|nr:hypothetical protein EDD18DRAFT_1356457 [Armillaria luteobubalina]
MHKPDCAVCTPRRDSYFTFSPHVDLSSTPSNAYIRKDTGAYSITGKTEAFSFAVSDQNTNIIMALKRKIEHVDVESNDLEDHPRRRGYRYEPDEFALSAFTETGRAELSIEVPKQRSYTGRSPVIPRALADTPCATLSIQGILDRLNATLRTSYTLPTAPSSSTSAASAAPSSATSVQDQVSLLSILEGCIQKNYDFGTAYAFLRPVWNTVNPSKIQDELRRRERRDRERRQKALVGNRIVDPYMRPRRDWDLCSNRVVPSWITGTDRVRGYKPTPISHAWVDEKDRVDVQTPINGKEWPVPIPKDVDLNLIRIEMLNLAAEAAEGYGTRYNWVQGPREDLRVEEWRLDVPTIGEVYQHTKVVIYLNGLGRPLRLKDGDLDSDRSWFRRAWTLQEVGLVRIIAGDTPDGPMHAQRVNSRNYETALLTRFHEELNSLEDIGFNFLAMMASMQKRVSTNPVDRVAGLAFPLSSYTIPAYHESETLEDAWTALVNALAPSTRADFLFMYPGVGLGSKKWRPTWDQVMKESLSQSGFSGYAEVEHNDEMDEDSYSGSCIEKGYVRGFDMGSAENHVRSGELVIKAADGIAHTFEIKVTHRLPIPEDTYTLLNSGDEYLTNQWAVGKQLPDQRFEKVSVIDGVYSDMNGDGLAEFTERRYFVLV